MLNVSHGEGARIERRIDRVPDRTGAPAGSCRCRRRRPRLGSHGLRGQSHAGPCGCDSEGYDRGLALFVVDGRWSALEYWWVTGSDAR